MCQSCGLPFNEEHAHFIATEPDGSKSIYCTNCYKHGKFIEPDISMEEMIEKIVPVLGNVIGEDEALQQILELIPKNHVVSWCGSETLNEIGIKELVKEKGYENKLIRFSA